MKRHLGPIVFWAPDGGPAGPVASIEKKLDQVVDGVETAIEKAGDNSDKGVAGIEKLVDKAEAVLLDPKATGEQKQELLAKLEAIFPKLMEVTDKWLGLESTVGELKSKAFSASPPTETPAAQSGDQTVSSSVPPVNLEDKAAPVQIPVPAAAPAATGENPSFLARLWRSIY